MISSTGGVKEPLWQMYGWDYESDFRREKISEFIS
jgi:hypothetical protein